MFILVLVVITAVCFDFTNGFHDTANAVATSIATGALRPRVAVAMAGVLNLAGAFISIKVAATIAKGIVDPTSLEHGSGLSLVFAALIGAIIWNLITWYFTLPSSSSHALIGGVIGATVAAEGSHNVMWHGVLSSVVAPGVLSPIICFGVAGIGTFFVYRLIRVLGEGSARRGYRYGQIASAGLVSLAHGTNDAQKTMGVITLALIAHGTIDPNHFYVPVWVKIACGVAMFLGTTIGGWRIINTMGNRLTDIESPQGFAAEAAGAAVILSSSYYGYPLSTTHVVTGGVMGAGAGKRLESVRWGVFGQMLTAWVLTIPLAGALGWVTWQVANLFGSNSSVGTLVMAILAAIAGAGLYALAQRNRISAKDLDRTQVPPETETRIGAPSAAAGAV
jgi:inorganic phosphate transporter, PiT family